MLLYFACSLFLRSAMATDGEEEMSDDQESETEDCDTEEEEGKIISFISTVRSVLYTSPHPEVHPISNLHTSYFSFLVRHCILRPVKSTPKIV